MSLKKDMAKLVKKVDATPGWRVEDRQDCWMCYSPNNGPIVNAHKTPSDHRAIKNTLARLRQAGFDG